jgi:cytochrome c-type biogenesis protein CcmH
MRRVLATVLMSGALMTGSLVMAEPAAAPDRPLVDAAQEARAKALFREVRCVVCQHESISDSPAGIAADMRALVREQVAAGKTDKAVREDLVRRYGDYVLFTPPIRSGTLMLWFGPFAAVVAVGIGLFMRSRRGRAEVQPLSDEEEAALASLLVSSNGQGDKTVSKPPLD